MSKKHSGALALLFFVMSSAVCSAAAVRIVSSTSDLAAIAGFLGGGRAKVESIANGKVNPHFIEVLPSYMIKVSRADIYLKVGMGLDLWADYIIDGSRNSKLKIIDCSSNILPLEKLNTRADASMGDIHPQGNPHYWLDPDNGIITATGITEALIELDPDNASYYEANLRSFEIRIKNSKERWLEKARPLKGIEIVTYHNSWPYFCRAFGIKVAGFVEPKPGIEPSPSHTAELVKMIKSRNIKIIGKEPYYSNRTPNTISRLTGAKIVDLPPSVGGEKGAEDYFKLFDILLNKLNAALEER